MQIKNLANWAEKNKHCPFTHKIIFCVKTGQPYWLNAIVPAGAKNIRISDLNTKTKE